MPDLRSRRVPSRPSRRSGEAIRVAILAALAAALIAGLMIDRTAGPVARVRDAAPVAGAPVAAPARALSSSWFCAGATDDHPRAGRPGGPAPGYVAIANSGSAAVPGLVTLVPSIGAAVRIPVTIPAHGRRVIAEDVPQGAPWIGAIVDVDAGGVAVAQDVYGPLGGSASPCATAGSSQWYFATGATLVNAQVGLSLLNPYPTDAIVDLSFTTSQGVESPEQFQGLTVPADGLVAVNLGDHLRRRQFIATTVTTRSGRLVAWKTQVVTPPLPGEVLLGTPAASSPLADPAAPVAGVTLTPGVPDPAATWTWAEGDAGSGMNESYVIYNPGRGTARLQLSIDLDQGVPEPFDLSVGPDEVTTVVSSQEVRIPPGVGHAAVLQSRNGVPVVAERVVAATSPSRWSGLGELAGGLVAASRWLFPAAQSDRTHNGWVVLYNPGSSPVRAALTALGPGGETGLGTVTVPPGRRVPIGLNQQQPALNLPLLLQASAPVYAELGIYGTGGAHGISLSFGVPLSTSNLNYVDDLKAPPMGRHVLFARIPSRARSST